MLEFGRELFQLSQRLEKENGTNEANQKMLEVSVRGRVLLLLFAPQVDQYLLHLDIVNNQMMPTFANPHFPHD